MLSGKNDEVVGALDESGVEMDNFYFTTGITQGILEKGHIIRDRR